MSKFLARINPVKVNNATSLGISAVRHLTAVAVLCLGLGLSGGTARAQMAFMPSLDDATLEKYDGLQLVTRVHITRTFVDHEKWGFFKIALEPVQVVEGVNIQVSCAGSLTNALDVINSSRLSTSNLRRTELRNLQVSLLGEKEPRLCAASASVIRPGALQLSHVSVTNAGGAISIPKATLQVSGPDCGCLRWNNAGGQEQLFVFQTSKN
ncbi:MAG TPA: hypothetical protein VMH87_05500 [Pseudomonadales bacterium]|nr:hypothetical protein [Pseudomonadales bacterium]